MRSKAAKAGSGIRVSRERLISLPVTSGFFVIGLASFAATPILLFSAIAPLGAAAYSDPLVVTLVHLYALGWGTAIALGAIQQFSVVAFQLEAAPIKPGAVSLALLVPGLALLLVGLGTSGGRWAAVGGALLLLSFAAALLTPVAALRQAPRRSVSKPFVGLAAVSLAGVAVVGILLATNRVTGWLGGAYPNTFASHLFLGPVGWFGMLIPGVAYELGPFFGLTRGDDPRDKGRGKYAPWVLLLLGAGFFGGLAAAAFGYNSSLWLLPLAAGYLLVVYDLRGLFKKRSELRRPAALPFVRYGHIWLFPLALTLGVIALWPEALATSRTIATFGFLTAAGWISNTILGYLHRILPFLLWHHRYWGLPKDQIGTAFQNMVSKRLGHTSAIVYNAGVLATAIGMWWSPLLSPAVIVLAVGTWLAAGNLIAAFWK